MENIWLLSMTTSGLVLFVMAMIVNCSGEYKHKLWQQAVVVVSIISFMFAVVSFIGYMWSI